MVGLLFGYIFCKNSKFNLISSQCLNAFRNLGLALFFAGTGFSTGSKNIVFDIRSILYGILITLTAIICGWTLCKFIRRKFPLHQGFIIAGGMTSIPAYGALAAVLRDILDTPVSPELLPADDGGNIAQKTEDLVGPYEIHDFYIYHLLRFGYAPDKLYRLAKVAFAGVYNDETLLKWLKNLLRRFFAQQFKRSCLPDGPKVGSVGLSPRGDWQMPSDASAAEWLRITENL